MPRLDVHAHFVPEGYRAALEAAGHVQPDGMPAIPAWTVDGHVNVLDRLGIGTALLSISSPGVHFGDDAAAGALARQVNEDGRRAVERHPGRFGLLASLPLPDVDGALAELTYAFDVLHADGVVLLTHVGDTYLGDPALEPVFAELDRRPRPRVHPPDLTAMLAAHLAGSSPPDDRVPLRHDASVTNLVLSGTIARHPGIELIVPHAGAALPSIADRVAAFAFVLADVDPGVDVARDLGRLHYDLAGFPLPRQLEALANLTTLDHLHYGSDYPFTPEPVVARLAEQLLDHGPRGELVERLTANTRRLFPLLAADGTDTAT